MWRLFSTCVLSTLLSCSLLAPVWAADRDFPNRPVRILVPYGPGGATDIVVRIVAEQLRKQTGQAFVVENKPGAYGLTALSEMVRAQPDGYTLMAGNVSTNAISPILFPNKMNYNYETSVAPVARLASVPQILVITNTIPVKTFAEFVAYAKKTDGNVMYASPGLGSFPQYATEVIARRAGVTFRHIPYKDGPAAFVKDMISGEVQASLLNAASAAPYIKSGRLTALAVAPSDARMPDFPDVPMLKEVGIESSGWEFWNALFAPAATPVEIQQFLLDQVNTALRSPEVLQAFKSANITGDPIASLDDAKSWLRKQMSIWKAITDEIKVDLNE